ncbi:MAG TPA: histidine phosphatase family protein [Candidatus Saccharimonadales bacterium]|nr:histidine phosphatase family protein [Candidatus Saccharimonadales bacterium]
MDKSNDITSLKNTYFILRHGESEANAARLITSDPAQCITRFGLTDRGRQQVTATIQKAKLQGWLDAETIIYCSDFKRTVETAQLARQTLHAGAIRLSPALRERFFGALDGKQTTEYVEIWPQDQHDEQVQKRSGVETAEATAGRLTKFVKDLEAQYRGKRLLLVSHGDPLQVLQAAFAGLEPEQSRALTYIKPAEIRRLT